MKLFSILKWYALTFGAWRRWRWWNSLTPMQKMNWLIRERFVKVLRDQVRYTQPLAGNYQPGFWTNSSVDKMSCDT